MTDVNVIQKSKANDEFEKWYVNSGLGLTKLTPRVTDKNIYQLELPLDTLKYSLNYDFVKILPGMRSTNVRFKYLCTKL